MGTTIVPAIFNPGALTLLSTVSFSGVSSLTSANNTFISKYENYRVLLKITTFVGQDQTLRFRSSGSDNTASSYRYAWTGIDTGGTARTGYATGQTSALVVRGNTAHQGIMSLTLDIFAPQLAQKTTATGQAWGSDGAPSSHTWNGGVAFDDTTVFDAFTLTFPGSTTGTMSIYGLVK
jgi:hypothetical protein